MLACLFVLHFLQDLSVFFISVFSLFATNPTSAKLLATTEGQGRLQQHTYTKRINKNFTAVVAIELKVECLIEINEIFNLFALVSAIPF